VTTVADGFERIDESLIHVTSGMVYARDIDRLEQIDLATGEVTEVATGLVPGPIGFTTPGGNMIVTRTQDGHILIDARTGEVVSRMKAPANLARFADDPMWPGWFDVANQGEVVIFAIATSQMPPSVSPDATPAVWLLSPDYPDGLEMDAPDDASNYWLSPDGETLYAYTSERSNGPGTIWSTPLGEESDWQVVVEEVTPLPVPMMFWPGE
jgi:hypothetical protein